jgi:hypothetical protein
LNRGNGLNLLRILNVALASALFTFSPPASAAVSPSAALVSPDGATASDKNQRQRSSSAAAAAAAVRRNTEGRARAEGPSNTGGGKAEQGIGQAQRANSDRLRSLLKRQGPRRRTAVAASHRGAASTAVPGRYAAARTIVAGGAPRASGDPGSRASNPSQGRTNLSQDPASAMRNGAAPRAAVALPQNSAATTGALGGARAQEHAWLGGPSVGKPTHAVALDGTQLRRRKH